MRTSTFILGLLAPTFALAANPSKDGSCGGYKGYSCKSSRFGECCSQHGWYAALEFRNALHELILVPGADQVKRIVARAVTQPLEPVDTV